MNESVKGKYTPDRKRKLSALGYIIELRMREEGVTGDYRNYVILHGGTLITYVKEYNVKSSESGEPIDLFNVAGGGAVEPNAPVRLLHRRDLWRVIGPVNAKKFWKYGARTRA